MCESQRHHKTDSKVKEFTEVEEGVTKALTDEGIKQTTGVMEKVKDFVKDLLGE